MSVQPPSLPSFPARPVRPGGISEEMYVKKYGQERLKTVDWVRKNILVVPPRPLITQTKSGFKPFLEKNILKIRPSGYDKEPQNRKAILLFHGATAGLSRKDAENYLDKLFGSDIDAFQRITEADIFWCSDKIEGRSELDLTLAGAINQDKFYAERGVEAYKLITEEGGYSPENIVILGHSKGAKQAELLREEICGKYGSRDKAPSFLLNAPIADGRSAARAILQKFSASNPQTKNDLLKSIVNGSISPKVHSRITDAGAFKHLEPKAFPCPIYTFLYVPLHDKFNESFNKERAPQQVTREDLLPKFSGILSKTPGITRDKKEYHQEAERYVNELTMKLEKNLLDYKDIKNFLEFLHMDEKKRDRKRENEGIPSRLERAEKALKEYNRNQSLGRFIRDGEKRASLKEIFEAATKQAPARSSAKDIIDFFKFTLDKTVKEIHHDLFEQDAENAALIPSDAHIVRIPIEDWQRILNKETEVTKQAEEPDTETSAVQFTPPVPKKNGDMREIIRS